MSRAASRNMPAAEKEGIRFILVQFDLISRGCTDQEDSTGDDKKKTILRLEMRRQQWGADTSMD
ncbi:MAG TPA: hypothetical protein DCG24_03980 [Bacteroidetes bacterium]|nr:hypothetical protein [Bacteroidota bacterium]HAE34982.1 hypothetical protein [Bacteroidota bacterium]